jgi:hypothetical protein
MGKLTKAYKWYLKGLFTHPSIELILTLSIFLEFLMSKNLPLMSFMIQSIIIPVYLLYTNLHIFRQRDFTVFEISMLRTWRAIPVAKALVLLTSSLPLIVIETVFLLFVNDSIHILNLIINIINYLVFSLIISLLNAREAGVIVLSIFLLLMPSGFSILVQTYISLNIRPDLTIQFLSYYFDTIVSEDYYKQGILQNSLSYFLMPILVIDLVLFLVYFLSFSRADLR